MLLFLLQALRMYLWSKRIECVLFKWCQCCNLVSFFLELTWFWRPRCIAGDYLLLLYISFLKCLVRVYTLIGFNFPIYYFGVRGITKSLHSSCPLYSFSDVEASWCSLLQVLTFFEMNTKRILDVFRHHGPCDTTFLEGFTNNGEILTKGTTRVIRWKADTQTGISVSVQAFC